MAYKVTWFFESAQLGTKYASSALGWTETFYFIDGSFSLDQVLQNRIIEDYIALRRACMNDIYRISWVRVSDDTNPRNFKIKAIDGGLGSCIATTGPNGKIQGQVNCALLVDMAKLPNLSVSPPDHTHHRRFLMRALPVDVIAGNLVNINGANWPFVYTFLSWLAFKESGNPQNPAAFPQNIPLNTKLGLRYQDPVVATYSPSPSTNATPGDDKTFVLQGTVTGSVGSHYTFRGFPETARDLNRTWQVQQQTAGTPGSTVFGRARKAIQSAAYTAPGSGQIRLVSPTYSLFDQFTIIGLRNKKTGRLFRQLRGRSSNR